MTKNYNENSRNIVRTWYNKSQDYVNRNSDLDSFMYLWISFNCFFVSECYNTAYIKKNNSIENESDKEEPSELNILKIFYSNQNYKELYLDLIENSISFKNGLNSFKNSLENKEFNQFQGRVTDLRPNRIKSSHAKKFININSFKQFILVVYQIRCNLFHGNKSPKNEKDIKIVNSIYNPFNELLYQIYKKEDYIND